MIPRYDNRLLPPFSQQVLIENDLFTLTVLENVYPSDQKFNGDGQTDFATYCVVGNRTKWALCP